MAISVAVAATKQVVVEADNGLNYTPLCSFTSADPTKFTVSASGLITGVAAGSAALNVSYLPAGAAQPITATDTVTVTV